MMKWRCLLQICHLLHCAQIKNNCAHYGTTFNALSSIYCPQSNILGWVGLVVAHPMYALLIILPFQLLTDPGPLEMHYHPRNSLLTHNVLKSMIIWANPCLLSPIHFIAQTKPQLLHISPMQGTTSCCIWTFAAPSTTSLTTTLMMHSRFLMILTGRIESSNGKLNWEKCSIKSRKLMMSYPGGPTPNNTLFFWQRTLPSGYPQRTFQADQRLPDPWRKPVHTAATPQQCSTSAFAMQPVNPWFLQLGSKTSHQKKWTNLKTFIREAYSCHLNATINPTGSQQYL